MELKSIFGLPAHPLIVHGAVVLLPLAAILVVVVALLPKARRIGAPIALGLAIVATVAVFLAEQSGESLEHQVKETSAVEAHTHAADAVLPWSVLVTLAAAAAVAADPLQRRLGKPSPKVAGAVLVVLALASATGATITVIDVGHSGAKATWGDTFKNAPKNGDGERDHDSDGG
ncbi:MAG: DUF2231 domain-containing protein [Acidimicrobiales bacterium]